MFSEKGGDAPSPKRVKLEDGAGDEDEEEIEGGGLDIAVGGEAVATMKMVAAETVDAEKTAAMIRSGKTLEERQEEFKEMLLERGVSKISLALQSLIRIPYPIVYLHKRRDTLGLM